MLVSIAAKKVIDHTNVRNRKKPVVVAVAVANRVSFYLMRSNDNGKKII
jgi:hypothetical protein